MNVFEFGLLLVLVSGVLLFSREVARLAATPEALAVLPLVAILVLLLRVFTRVRPSMLLYLSALLIAVSLLSMGLAKELALRESILIVPVSAGLILIAIRGVFLVTRYRKTPDTTTQL